MQAVSGLNWLAAGVLACSALGCGPQLHASDSTAVPLTPVAHSALVTLEAGPAAAAGLVLRLRHTADQTPLSVTDLTVSVDGRSQLAMRREDGSWFVPLSEAITDAQLEVVVAHDGIREILSGRVTIPGARTGSARNAGGTASVLRDHKQMAWWILNIAIVLIAAIAISRRLS